MAQNKPKNPKSDYSDYPILFSPSPADRRARQWLGTLLLAGTDVVIILLLEQLHALARQAAVGVPGTEFAGMNIIFCIYGALFVLALGLLSIGPWMRQVPREIRVLRLIIIAAGLLLVFFALNR